MTGAEYFDCKKHSCILTIDACKTRRTAFSERGRRLIPTYPECQECDQYYVVQKHQTGGEKIMAKIDQDKLKKLVSEGKTDKECAAIFGVSEGGIWAMRKKLGLKANYQRQQKGASASRPRPQSPAAVPAQIGRAHV